MNGKIPTYDELYNRHILPTYADPQPPEPSHRPLSRPPRLSGPYLSADGAENRSVNASIVPEPIPMQHMTRPIPAQVTLPEQLTTMNPQYIQKLQNALHVLSTTNPTNINAMLSSGQGLNMNPAMSQNLGQLLTNSVSGQANPNPVGLNSAFSIVSGGQAHLRPPITLPTTTTALNSNMVQSSHGSAFLNPNTLALLAMLNQNVPYYNFNGGLPMTNQTMKMENVGASIPKLPVGQPVLPKLGPGNMPITTSANDNSFIKREPHTSTGFSNYEGPWNVPNAMTYNESVIKEEFARNNDCVKINMKPNSSTTLSNNMDLRFPGIPQAEVNPKNKEMYANWTPTSNNGATTFMQNQEFNRMLDKETPLPASIGSPIVAQPAVPQERIQNPIFTPSPEPLRMVNPSLENGNAAFIKKMDHDPSTSVFDFKVGVVERNWNMLNRNLDAQFNPNGLPAMNNANKNENKRKADEEADAPCKKSVRFDRQI